MICKPSGMGYTDAERISLQVAGELAQGCGAGPAWEQAFQATDDGLRSEEGCTATALLVWRDAQGAVCLQVHCFPTIAIL